MVEKKLLKDITVVDITFKATKKELELLDQVFKGYLSKHKYPIDPYATKNDTFNKIYKQMALHWKRVDMSSLEDEAIKITSAVNCMHRIMREINEKILYE